MHEAQYNRLKAVNDVTLQNEQIEKSIKCQQTLQYY